MKAPIDRIADLEAKVEAFISHLPMLEDLKIEYERMKAEGHSFAQTLEKEIAERLHPVLPDPTAEQKGEPQK